jgi:histidine kinase/DNA gyrase B/HSP90-like ATPase/histidine kinase
VPRSAAALGDAGTPTGRAESTIDRRRAGRYGPGVSQLEQPVAIRGQPAGAGGWVPWSSAWASAWCPSPSSAGGDQGRVYDIDLIISRALVYGTLAAFITAVYVAIVVGVGTLVGAGGQPSLGLSILATQQRVEALRVKLGLARSLAGTDPSRAAKLVGQLAADADEALQTLRDLARGIYPPLLADRGLAAAVEAQARRSAVPVVAEADEVGRYEREVEAAVYFCVLEALQNVQKYASAGQATVRLWSHDGELVFEVADDGRGFDVRAAPSGGGLTNMADRLDALGGGLRVDSAPGRGTRLRGTVPAPPVDA